MTLRQARARIDDRRRVLRVLAQREATTMDRRVSLLWVQRDTGFGERRVRACLLDALDCGHVDRRRSWGSSHGYWLTAAGRGWLDG